MPAALVLFLSATDAGAGLVADRATPLLEAPLTCQRWLFDDTGNLGQFDWQNERVQADRALVCAPIRRLYEEGFPTTRGNRWSGTGQIGLGQAIFILAHEATHVRQWLEHGRAWPEPNYFNEADADCAAAATFRSFARGVGIRLWSRRVLLESAVKRWIGYRPPLPCWPS